MLLPNPDIDERALARLVADRYAVDSSAISIAPVGGDGWHYRCPPFWVSVRRDRQGHTPTAYHAARELRDAGLEFVLAPLADNSEDDDRWRELLLYLRYNCLKRSARCCA